MSMYTTGEIAKKCNVSVRTVQYYDEKGILTPSELTEGGRRLFSENDVRTLETICFLKELGISLKDIAAILRSDESEDVVTLLLEQRATDLEKEIAEKNEQLSKVKELKGMLSTFEDSSEKSIHDISKIMEARKNLKQMYVKILVSGLFVEALEVASFVYGILRRNFIPFAAVMVLVCIYAYIIFRYWHRNIMYICPQCHTTFKPKKREAFFAGHTAKTRKLTCPECNRKMWCVETYEEAK
jgi:DNA-binding transcriptional MerR regulator/DNA-directed RNA polymerase subunit RPC12/RpoP